MEIRNIVVGLTIDSFDRDLVALVSDLAQRHKARLIGYAAAQPPVVASMGAGDVAGALYSQELNEIEEAINTMRDSFQSALSDSVEHEWEGRIQQPSVGLIDIARKADLIVVAQPGEQHEDGYRHIDLGDVLQGAGRPVLIAAQGASSLLADKIVIAWKDTREARRAVVDALPLLKGARDVQVVVIDEGHLREERNSMLDLVAWLKSHAVTARGEVLPNEDSPAAAVNGAASAMGADLVVSGAYGHSRLRQWLVGGMTRDLLATATINRLLSN